MTFDRTKVIWASAVKMWNPASAAEETQYFATKNAPFTVGGGPPSAFKFLLQQPAVVSRFAFGDRTTSGRGVAAAGNCVLDNRIATNGPLDIYQRCAVDGRQITTYVCGETLPDFPSGFTTVLDGTMQSWAFGQEEVVIDLRDWQRAAETPIQTTVYAGTGALEGGSDLIGKPKPILLGKARNFTPIQVNGPKNIWQIHDGTIASIDGVFDSGRSLATSVGSWTSQTSGAGATTIRDAVWCESFALWIWVGDGGKLYTSPDAVTWTSRTWGGGANDIKAVDFGRVNGVDTAVAVGAGGRVAKSTNGTSWSLVATLGGTATAVGIANNECIVGMAGGGIYETTDLSTFNSRTSHVVTDVVGVVFGATAGDAGYWVAVTSGGEITTSPDGTTWTANATVSASGMTNVCYGGGTFVVFLGVGAGSNVLVSTNGTTFSLRSLDVVTGAFGTAGAYGNGTFVAACIGAGSPSIAASSVDGGNVWFEQPLGSTGAGLYAAAFGNNLFLVAGASGELRTSSAVAAYANSTDLQDDTLAPKEGTYKYLSSAGGSYIRLASVPSKLTVSATQGATAADRTAAQLAVYVLGRAGFVGGDWSASDVTTLDSKNSAVLGDYITEPDIKCATVIDRLLGTVGAWWAPDRTGVIRMQRLEDPAPNLISSPQALATAPWANGGGTTTATNGVGVYAGRSFCRIANVTGGNWIQQWTPPASGTYWFTFYVKRDASNGTVVQLLQDVTSGLTKAQVIWTIAADGTMTASVPIGTVQRSVLMVGNEGVYAVTVKATGVVFGNNNTFYASTNSGATATNFLMTDVLITQNDPDATINQSPDMDGMTEVKSNDENGGIPTSRTIVRYSKNFTPLSGADLAGRVSESQRTLFMAEWLDAKTAIDSAVTTAHPLATTRVVESCFAELADAQAEADRLQALFKVDRRWFEVPVFVSDTLAAVDLVHVAELVSTRYDCNAGKRFRVLGVRPDAGEGRIILSVWG